MIKYISALLCVVSIYTLYGYASSIESSKQDLPSENNLIRGLDVVGCGFDVTTLESRLCLFDLENPDDNSNWTDPHNRSLTFRVPQGFDVMDASDYLEGDDIQIIRNIYEFVTRTFYHSRQDRSGFLGFSSSRRTVQSEFIHHRFYQFDYYLASRMRQIAWYSLSVRTFPVPNFSSVARSAISSLPTTFNPNNASIINEFEEFFRHFGTHMVTSSNMGGLVWLQDWFESCLLRTTNTSWIREQVTRRHAWGLFRSSTVTQTTTRVISEQYTKHSTYSLQLLGGTESVNASKWHEWIPTVKYNPRPISYDLVPIYRLLPANSDQRKALENATLHFRTQAAINERNYITKLQEIPKPPNSRCQKPISKRSLNENLLQSKQHHDIRRGTSIFQLTEEAQQALCPFVGTEGMRCSDDKPVRTSGRNFDSDLKNLPVGVGISLDRSTGRLMAPALKLTHSTDGSRTWTDGHSGTMFNLFNEAILGPPNRETAAYNVHRIRIFNNASQLDEGWRQTFAEGSVRGGELARAPDMLDYHDKYFVHQDAFVLSQRAIGLYTLQVNTSTIKLNRFAKHALSQLTTTFNGDLYEDFLSVWGTHIITRSLIGGMVEERAKVKQCLTVFGHDTMTRCIPFSERNPMSSDCPYYASRALVTSKRLLGGNVGLSNENDWKRTIANGPALLQILEIVPWHNFVDNEVVKENLRTAIRYRLQMAAAVQAAVVRQINARYTPWSPNLSSILNVHPNVCLPHKDDSERTPVPSACVVNQFYCRPISNTDFKVKFERDDSNNLARVALYNTTTTTTRLVCRQGLCRPAFRPRHPQTIAQDIPTQQVGSYIRNGCSTTTVPECNHIPVGVCMSCSTHDPVSCQIGNYECPAYN